MAAEFITAVRTKDKDVKIDYRFLAHKPEFDTTLTAEGCIADAKAVGDKIVAIEKQAKSLAETKADTTYVNERTDVLTATQENDGQILRVAKVVNDDGSESWEASWQSASSALDATQEDEGKILTVVKVVGDDESESWVSLWQTPTDALNTLYANEANEGKVLRVVKDTNEEETDSWHVEWEPALSALDATDGDEGKILTVVNGKAQWETPSNAFAPSVDDDGEGDSGDEQNSAGQILTNVNGLAQWTDLYTALAVDASDGDTNQFLSVMFTEKGKKVAYWRTVIDADKVEF